MEFRTIPIIPAAGAGLKGIFGLLIIGLCISGIIQGQDKSWKHSEPYYDQEKRVLIYNQNQKLIDENRARFNSQFEASGMGWGEYVRSRGLDPSNPDHMWRMGNTSLPTYEEHQNTLCFHCS